MLSPSQTTWAPPGVPWGLGLQGLRETTGWQEGEAMEDVLPETLGDRLMGKEGRHPEPSRAHQSIQGSLSKSFIFIELKSVEHNVERGRWS